MDNKYYTEIIGNKCFVLLNGSIVDSNFRTLKDAEIYANYLNFGGELGLIG